MLILGFPAKKSDLFPERSTSSQLPLTVVSLLWGKADQTLVGCISLSASPNTRGQNHRKPFPQGLSVHLFPAKILSPTCTTKFPAHEAGSPEHLRLNSGLWQKHHYLRALTPGASRVGGVAVAGGWVGGCLLHCCTARKMQSAKVLATEVRELFNSDSMSLLFFFFFWSTSPFFLIPFFFEKLVTAEFQKCL